MRLIVCMAAASSSLVAAAPAAAQTHAFDIRAGSLSQAILEFGRQARISIALGEPAIANVRVRAVRGSMTVDQALARMLSGTSARAVRVGPTLYRIVPSRSADRARGTPMPRAQRTPQLQLADQDAIVVTASKRRLAVRDYPGPVTVVAASELPLSADAAGSDALVRHIAALGSTYLGPGRDKLFIRAIADSSFSGQTQATVGQYLGEARLNYNAPDPNLRLYDMGSVELLPGPQGTLYGAGTIGGVLNARPNAPEFGTASGALRVSAAATQHGEASGELAGVLNLPVVDDIAALRLVAYGIRDGAYIDDVGRGQDDVNRTSIAGGRAALRLALSENVEVQVTGAGQMIDGRDSQYAEPSEGPLKRSSLFAQPFANSFALGNVVLQSSAGKSRLTVSGTVSKNRLLETFDASIDAEQPRFFRQLNRARLAAAEARLSRDHGDGSGWLVGMSLAHNKRRRERGSGPPGRIVDDGTLHNNISEQTLFGEATVPLYGRLKLTGGARLTHVVSIGRLVGGPQRVGMAEQRSSDREWQFLPSVAVSASLPADATVYARYQEGFRPGGVILVAGQSQRIKSDHVAALETGVRLRSIAGLPVGGAIAASYTRWKDVQADLIDSTGFPSTINLGDGNVWTLDAELEAQPAVGLTIRLAGVFNRSAVTNHDPGIIIVDGDPLPNVPGFSGRLGVDYTRSIWGSAELRVLGWARYIGRSRLGIGPNLGRDQGNYLDTGIEAQVGLGALRAFVTVTNLLDAVGNRFALGSIPTFGLEEQTTPMRPRTIRVGVGTGF